MLTVEQFTQKLKDANITDSQQVVRRWLRQGKIAGHIENKKTGWMIDEQIADSFIIEYHKSTRLENACLKKELEQYKIIVKDQSREITYLRELLANMEDEIKLAKKKGREEGRKERLKLKQRIELLESIIDNMGNTNKKGSPKGFRSQ